MAESESTTQHVGQLLKARYRIERVLHAGERACVFAGTDTRVSPPARVAIKLIEPERARVPAFHDRFLQRAYVANAVGHPSAVTALDAGITEDGAAFLVMELVTGESLQALRAQYGGKLPLRLACAVADQCLDMLACAHPQQIFHGALTPEHLFWVRGSQLKVIGFGSLPLEGAEADATSARNADLSAIAQLWYWLLGDDTDAALVGLVPKPHGLFAVFDKARSASWLSADAMRRALARAHRTELGSRIHVGLQPTAAGGGGLDAPMSWLWIWLAASGLAVSLLALSALLSEQEPRPRPDGASTLAQTSPQDGDGEQAEGAAPAQQPDAATGETQASDTPAETEEPEPSEAPERPGEEHSGAPRVVPRGPSLKALQLPMRGRNLPGSSRASMMPVATAHRLCTDLAARRREEPLSDADREAWDENCQKH